MTEIVKKGHRYCAVLFCNQNETAGTPMLTVPSNPAVREHFLTSLRRPESWTQRKMRVKNGALPRVDVCAPHVETSGGRFVLKPLTEDPLFLAAIASQTTRAPSAQLSSTAPAERQAVNHAAHHPEFVVKFAPGPTPRKPPRDRSSVQAPETHVSEKNRFRME